MRIANMQVNPNLEVIMASKKVLKDYIRKKDLRDINDPLELLADALLDNERLRRKITKCKCD